METIDVKAYEAVRNSGEEHLLLDVREQAEWNICHIEGATLVPLQTVPQALEQLAEWKDKPVYCMCHHGGRSHQAGMFLEAQGFNKVTNVMGGMHEWAVKVDTSLSTY